MIFFARYEASSFGSPYIEPEHILLGLLREDQTLKSRLPAGGIEQIRKRIEESCPHREKTSTSVDLPLSSEAKPAKAKNAMMAVATRKPGKGWSDSISAMEAFTYATTKTAAFYDSQKRLATEHALIEDLGKGEGVKAPSPENGEGLIAGRQVLLHLGSVASIVNDPEKQKLLKHKDELETQIDELKYRKAAVPQREYQLQMRQLLLDLATVQEGLDK